MLEGLPVGQISAGALVAVIILLILNGRLVTRRQLMDKTADCDKWRESSENWQKSAHELGMAFHDLSRAVDKLTIQGEATDHALTEIQALARGWERP